MDPFSVGPLTGKKPIVKENDRDLTGKVQNADYSQSQTEGGDDALARTNEGIKTYEAFGNKTPFSQRETC